MCIKFTILLFLWSGMSLHSCHSSMVDGATKIPKIKLPGASGSETLNVLHEWVVAFSVLYPEVNIEVASVGIGENQQALWGDIDCTNKTLNSSLCYNGEPFGPTLWGMGDGPLDEKVYYDHPTLQLQQYPVFAGAVVIACSADVVPRSSSELEIPDSLVSKDHALHLSMDAVAGIFNRSITYWDDESIEKLNPSIQSLLPHQPITVVVRADPCGQSSILTEALKSNVPSWPDAAVGFVPEWPLGKLHEILEFPGVAMAEDWENQTWHYHAWGTNDLAYALVKIPYSLGYIGMGLYNQLSGFLGQVYISSSAYPQTFIAANQSSIKTTMEGLADKLDPKRLDVMLAQGSVEGGYPIAGYIYFYIKQNFSAYESCYQAWLLCKFVEWTYTDRQAKHAALENGWVSPSQSVVKVALERLAGVQCLDVESGRVVSAMSYTPPPYIVDEHYINKLRPVVWTMAGVILAASARFVAWVLTHRSERVVQASQPSFLIMICVGTFVMGSAIFPLGIDDSIATVRGCNIACMSVAWLVACGFSIAFSALFSKVWRLNMLIRSASRFRRVKIESKDVLGPFLAIFSLNVVFLLAWTLVDPMKWVRTKYDRFNSYGHCRPEGDQWKIFLSCIVVVDAGALVLANVEAFKARNVSDEFSESKYIFAAMVCLLQSLLLGLPLIALSIENPAAKLFTMSGILFVCTMSLLLLMFVPKILCVRRDKQQNKTDSGDNKGRDGPGILVEPGEGCNHEPGDVSNTKTASSTPARGPDWSDVK